MLSHETLSRIGHSGGMGVLLNNFQDCMGKLKEQGPLMAAYVFLALLAGRSPRHRGRLRFSLGLFGSAMLANAMMISPGYYADRPAFGWVMMLIVACALLAPALAEVRELPLWDAVVVCLALSAAVTYLWALPACYNRYRQAEARVAYVREQRDAGVADVVAFRIKSHSRYDVYCDGNVFSAVAEYGPNACFAKRYGVESFAVSMESY
jgi:membrane protein implicated in regulation of membrane protease activity